MRCVLHYLLLTLSSLLLLATTCLWIRSHRASDLCQSTRYFDIDQMNIIEEGYQYSSANSGLSFCYSYKHLKFRDAAEAIRVRGYLRYAIMDGKYRSHWMIIPWRQYGGANGEGLRATILGFQFRSNDDQRSPGASRFWIITIPCPLPFLIFAILPALTLRRFLKFRRTTRRQKLGLCPSCGYDLRNLPSPRCPECGQTAAPNPAPACEKSLLLPNKLIQKT
jgi:hypothetical protein